jgi:hypothetical protein
LHLFSNGRLLLTSAIAKEAPCPVPLIGYARISTEDQTALPQVQELRSAGCVEIVEEQASGGSLNRPGFTGGQNSRRIARYGTDI